MTPEGKRPLGRFLSVGGKITLKYSQRLRLEVWIELM
jgi:hypothetical protein